MHMNVQLILLLSVTMTHHLTLAQTCNERQLPGPTLVDMCGESGMLMSFLDSAIRKNEKISGICERVTPIETPDPEYDYIVVGGGAAGSVVAARLSEISHWKVLLLEAGDDEPASAQIPSFTTDIEGSSLEWGYLTTNESHACLSTNASCKYAAAKALGGCTVHNGMIYLRGNPTDYNNWAAMGNEGWTWDEVKPFFLKAEDNGEIDRVGRFWHATGGPLFVERSRYQPPFTDSILRAAEEAGFGVSEDLNGDETTGFAIVQTTSKNGVRRSSATSYLRPIRNRENLHISLNTTVTRVIIEDGKAVGVEYFKNDEFKTVRALREVILSAGNVKSPHILLLSGIGPKEHLESMGITVVKDLPGVGSNYHDHPYFMLSFTINENDVYDNDWAVAAEYLAFQTGPLSSYGIAGAIAHIASTATTPDYPDIQIFSAGYQADCAPGEIGALRSTGRRTVTLSALYLHPKSRGRISLASNDPFESPLIWGNFLSEPSDVVGILEGINIVLKLTNSNTLRSHNMTLSMSILEACRDYTFATTEYWKCALHQAVKPVGHGTGSCKMGPKHDAMAVVDHKLRVRGIKGLRVADTSIMPQIITGNTASPTMMIGERVSEFIKESSGLSSESRMGVVPTK
ncbi:glucose dehydrogenase [FAD, quinone]-like [Neodiprion virginianus]|uniref:glucose dehydrogenase [FAD, quinone]-like n=1 Tax=Neodiprion virginianus TaxID=2961670 RepID=UPI001EE6E5EF|nr:glucose dehydrogenase [FAD, quinone]-like [Neodiprion virginianus]XP_046607200.1 glucose dehydrogenase [FAD, quinone]-like [Neodiprion virginianus]XP_046607209.1 glucose dehydrogenase [FAD, quinone]-like [Neodiprion virginianus]XP_046607220.1 glucose dehydrogenase [FAD, quinone]-like [Neodiprion virginianus]XP_046607228.1 glucose dehydrogenase [FAD, quinone]-like [Neodiprion virginianus]XP_046607236.1 glucose dehydrogenase [FAD, quinone]-like [Neodiprion virginianus]